MQSPTMVVNDLGKQELNMQVRLHINEETKVVNILGDKVNGSKFDLELAKMIFKLEDEGYTSISGNKKITHKFHNYKVACYRV